MKVVWCFTVAFSVSLVLALLVYPPTPPLKLVYFRGTPVWPDDDFPPDQRVLVVEGRVPHVYPENYLPEHAIAINDGKYVIVYTKEGTRLLLRQRKNLILDNAEMLVDADSHDSWDPRTGQSKRETTDDLSNVPLKWEKWGAIKAEVEKKDGRILSLDLD